jgi:hypothetical protein
VSVPQDEDEDEEEEVKVTAAKDTKDVKKWGSCWVAVVVVERCGVGLDGGDAWAAPGVGCLVGEGA